MMKAEILTIAWKSDQNRKKSLHKVKAKQAHKELNRIKDEAKGVLSPIAVVRASRDPESVLHSEFVWDDSKAAERYRVAQARRLIQDIEVVYKKAPDVPVRAFESIQRPRTAASVKQVRVYENTAAILSDANMRDQLLANAIIDAKRFRARYNGLQEIAQVLRAFDDFVLSYDEADVEEAG